MNNDGPAFPNDGFPEGHKRAGMTLRDFFAAKAMPSFKWYYDLTNIQKQDLETAKRCYAVADAMLKAREVSQ